MKIDPDDNKPTAERALNRIEGPGFDYLDALDELRQHLAAAQAHYLDICASLDALEAAGMWPAVPGVSWESRNGGENVYMRLRWKGDSGPGGATATYIGNDPDRVGWAQARINNRKRWEHLDRTRQRLRRWLQEQATAIRWKASTAVHYHQVKDLADYRPDPRHADDPTEDPNGTTV